MSQTIDTTQVRWFLRSDMQDVMAIENAAFPDCPWEEADFSECLKSRSVVGLVCEREDAVIGFMVYELCGGFSQILNMSVHSAFRHEGIGSLFLAKLHQKLSDRRSEIVIDVRESNVDCQLFLKANDFKCREILKEHYDNGETAYRFRYNLFGMDE